ncbi:MAG: hypothetical protein KZQ99_06685 [Candidatus Thiodiazotropha sp. (ex Dulcina madagascariensis)]|nr:hypothetical protein [Candidatus Thiodiazotropha sp. (ex Dulcina madagascariensis)]
MTNELSTNTRDRLVSVAKAAAGGLPLVGNLISEALDTIVPELRFDRAVKFLTELDARVQEIEGKIEFEKNLSTEVGLDLLEEGIIQASRSVSEERKERLARLVAQSLSQEDLRYEESRKLLNIYRELTDPEVVWLIYYSLNPVLGGGMHNNWFMKHEEILSPVRQVMGLPQEEYNRGALQESYKNTLLQLGLTEQKGSSTSITTLGRMLVSYIHGEEIKNEDQS